MFLYKSWGVVKLQSVRQGLVEFGNLGGDAEVDGPVTDFDDESAEDVGVDLYEIVSSFSFSTFCFSLFLNGGKFQLGINSLPWSRP